MNVEKNYIEVPFEIKTEDIKEDGTFSGYGSTFGGKPDSYGDVIRYGAFSDTIRNGGRNGNGIAMLWQHRESEPIGVWTDLVENTKGLKVTGKLALKIQRGLEAYELMKMGALKGLSIGWGLAKDKDGNVLEDSYEYDDKKRIRYLKKVDLWEISPVTFPANIRATITNVKSLIENAKNVRELEQALRDECYMSNSAAKYIVSLCKEKLFDRDDLNKGNEEELINEKQKNRSKYLTNILLKLKESNELVKSIII